MIIAKILLLLVLGVALLLVYTVAFWIILGVTDPGHPKAMAPAVLYMNPIYWVLMLAIVGVEIWAGRGIIARWN